MSSTRRALLLTPLAVGGCVTTEYSEGGTTWGDALDHASSETVQPLSVAAEQLIARWQLPAESPWGAYSKLVLPTARDEFEALPAGAYATLTGPERCAADQVAAAGVPADMMWLVDLKGAQSVRFAAELSRASRDPIAPILTFNNWPANDELIPTRTVLAALASETPKLPTPGVKAAPVFVLDSDRLAFAGQETDSARYDNRYIITEPDLPSVEVLKAQGIVRLVYLVDDKNARTDETDDLNPLLLAYQNAGIEISLVDLNDLCQLQPPVAQEPALIPDQGYTYYSGYTTFWEPWLWHRGFWVRTRPLVCNLEFFHRSHGGFGGRHAFNGFGHSGFHSASAITGHSGGGGGFHASGGFGSHGGFGGGGFGHSGFGSHGGFGGGGFGHGGFGGHGGGG